MLPRCGVAGKYGVVGELGADARLAALLRPPIDAGEAKPLRSKAGTSWKFLLMPARGFQPPPPTPRGPNGSTGMAMAAVPVLARQ